MYYNGTIYSVTHPQGLHGQFRGIDGNIESLKAAYTPEMIFWDDQGIPHLLAEAWHFKADSNA